MNIKEMYVDGEYLKNNPTWDIEHSTWKAEQIYRLIQKHELKPQTICEVGCGCDEILRQLHYRMPAMCFLPVMKFPPKPIISAVSGKTRGSVSN